MASDILKSKTRNSSGDEIPERDFFIYDDIAHALENTKIENTNS